MQKTLSSILADFSDISTRGQASESLCRFFKAESLIIFYLDTAAAAYLPAPGFPQTIKNMAAWQKVLKDAEGKDLYEGQAFFEPEGKKVISVGSRNKCYMLLVNPTCNLSCLTELQQLFALIASLILMETEAVDLKARMKNAATATRKAEKLAVSLDNVTNKLQQALRTEEEFLSVASHELKTPITSINAFVHVLQELYPAEKDEKTNKILTRIKFQINKIIELISDLLDTSKLQLEGLPLKMEPTYLDPIVREAIEDLRSIHPERQILLNGATNSKIVCDKNRIGQVINNLLTNALKYSAPATIIVVKLSDNEEEVHLLVRDFGIGIAKDNLPKVFSRFFRAHGSDSGRLSSLGLGLYIAENIIERHRGKIWVESEQGQGSTFHFTLPIK